MSTGPKHPSISVQLTGEDGNAFSVIGRVMAALRRAGVPGHERVEFMMEATSEDYDHVIATCRKWVDVR